MPEPDDRGVPPTPTAMEMQRKLGRLARVVVVMGVSGCGKSTVGRMLAEKLDAVFLDGDDFHAPESKEKMRAGIPLTDDDRWRWMATLGEQARNRQEQEGRIVVLACSALKRRYREFIGTAAGQPLLFVFLDGREDIIAQRLERRRHEFMNRTLLSSQFATLERPDADENAVTFSVDRRADEIALDAARQVSAFNTTMV